MVLAAAFYLACLAIIALLVWSAPEGFEDERGFHLTDHAGSDLPDALAAPAPVSVPFHTPGVSQ